MINNPHNPTGYLMSKDKFEALVKIAKENNLFLFSDEVYRGLEYKQEDRLPAVCEVYDKGISLGVMSKTFGLAGLRIGWIVAKDGDLLKKIASFKDFTTIDNSAPSEFLATLALRHKEEIIKRNLEIIKGNLKLVDDFLIKHGDLFEWTRPRAGPIGLVKMNFDKNSEDFCIDVVEKKSLMLLPSTVYDIGDKHFRVGMGRKNTPEALKKFEEYIQDNL
ncbi:MAG: aminotransferase class I/II-fold pyridoxal phosphate-dependent enzyme [archaeon]